VLNLTPSIAITHNYVGEHNLLQGRASSTRANSTPRHCLELPCVPPSAPAHAHVVCMRAQSSVCVPFAGRSRCEGKH
jgi:hypothetical protein